MHDKLWLILDLEEIEFKSVEWVSKCRYLCFHVGMYTRVQNVWSLLVCMVPFWNCSWSKEGEKIHGMYYVLRSNNYPIHSQTSFSLFIYFLQVMNIVQYKFLHSAISTYKVMLEQVGISIWKNNSLKIPLLHVLAFRSCQ